MTRIQRILTDPAQSVLPREIANIPTPAELCVLAARLVKEHGQGANYDAIPLARTYFGKSWR